MLSHVLLWFCTGVLRTLFSQTSLLIDLVFLTMGSGSCCYDWRRLSFKRPASSFPEPLCPSELPPAGSCLPVLPVNQTLAWSPGAVLCCASSWCTSQHLELHCLRVTAVEVTTDYHVIIIFSLGVNSQGRAAVSPFQFRKAGTGYTEVT